MSSSKEKKHSCSWSGSERRIRLRGLKREREKITERKT